MPMRAPFLLLAVVALAASGWIGLARRAAEVRTTAEAATSDSSWRPVVWPTRTGPVVETDPTWHAFVVRRRGSRIFAGWSPDRTPRVVAIDPSTGRWETVTRRPGWLLRLAPNRK